MANLLALLVFLAVWPAKTPASFPSARQKARETDRPLAIFFVPPGCQACEVHWQEFLASQDVQAYIPLKLNTNDFDARIILDAWGPASVPGWTILLPDGTVRDKWTGSWDRNPFPVDTQIADAMGKPSPASPAPDTGKTTDTGTPEPPQKGGEKLVQPAAVTLEGFRIQAGFFSSKPNADNLIDQLDAKGFPGYSTMVGQTPNGSFFRVVSPVFADNLEARKAANALQGAGFPATVKPLNTL